MRIAIVGPGSLGAQYGHILTDGGQDVVLIARGDHLAAIQKSGLTLRDGDDEVTVRIEATDDPSALDPVDLVLFCVKTYDLKEAAEKTRPLIADETVVIPVQNGVTSGERIAAILGDGHVLGGLTYRDGYVVGPGVVSCGGVKADLIFGELDGIGSERVSRINAMFDDAGMPSELRSDIQLCLWQKFVNICGTAGVLGLLRLPMGPVVDCPESRALFLGVMKEVEVLARARGIDIEEGYAEQRVEHFASNVPPNTRSSLLVDITRGRRLELEHLNGTALKLGDESGVPMPFNSACYAGLKPYVNGPPVIPE